jgi:methyl-accepting chemotaxis protein
VGLVEANVKSADRAMNATRANIDEVTTRNEQAMFWVVVVATLLGVFLAFSITVSIVRPMRRMAGLLDRLASEQPADRVPFFPGGRDEVNLMAGSVNAMADHKAGFIDWWKATMREADACERLQELMRQPRALDERLQVEEELRQSVLARKELLREQHQSIHRLVDRIIDRAEVLLEDARPGSNEVALNTIRYSARSVQTKLEMVSGLEIGQKGAA